MDSGDLLSATPMTEPSLTPALSRYCATALERVSSSRYDIAPVDQAKATRLHVRRHSPQKGHPPSGRGHIAARVDSRQQTAASAGLHSGYRGLPHQLPVTSPMKQEPAAYCQTAPRLSHAQKTLRKIQTINCTEESKSTPKIRASPDGWSELVKPWDSQR